MRHSYFLISVSNKKNLDLCLKFALAGFTNSINGVWTFLDIREGDYVSFLYGAKAYNLYIIENKEAIKNAESVPPWPPVTFKQSGKTYYFPFRLQLKPIRKFEESLVRAEFNYVAENLLLRGGYRRTHFQADQTTLQAVSQMGFLYDGSVEQLTIADKDTFIPKFSKNRGNILIPEFFPFQELILQAVVRRYLNESNNMDKVLRIAGVDMPPETLEILGEKAFPEGHVDILIKEATPTGITRKIIIEVKTGTAKEQDIKQLRSYAEEIGAECAAAILIASKFSKKIVQKANNEGIKVLRYGFKTFNGAKEPFAFKELCEDFHIEGVEE
jgi:hypothetical protein